VNHLEGDGDLPAALWSDGEGGDDDIAVASIERGTSALRSETTTDTARRLSLRANASSSILGSPARARWSGVVTSNRMIPFFRISARSPVRI
jgi:hypothetical protein